MTIDQIKTEIRTLRGQIEALERKVQSMEAQPRHSIADLEGMLEGVSNTSEEQIDAVRYRGSKDQP